MRGFIKKRGNSYRIAISLGRDLKNGKYQYYWETCPGTKRDAEIRLNELLHQQDTGVFIKPGKSTLGEYLLQWLKDVKPNLGPVSYQTYEIMVTKHINPTIGNILLSKLTPQHLQGLYSEKLLSGRCDGKGGLSNRSVLYIHTTLHKSLATAVKLGLLLRNPADAVDPPHIQQHELMFMDEGDIEKFLGEAKKSEYYELFFTALATGARRSELLALKWADIDLFGCTLSISRTLHVLNDNTLIFKETKTIKSKRMIALTPANVILLREYQQEQAAQKEQFGLTLSDDDLVFNRNGNPFLPDTITHAWMVIAKHSGLKKITFHSARHSHASILLKKNIHPRIVQERLGHSNIGTTLNVYSHVMPGLQQAAALRFDEALPKQITKLEKELKDIIEK